MKDIEIRYALPLDTVAIVKLIKRGYDERRLPYQEPDDALSMEMCLRLIIHGFTLVAVRGGRIVGVHANFISNEEWSARKFLDNAFFYILPAERKHGTAEMMMEMVEKNADGGKLWYRQGTFMEGETLGKMLEKRGFRCIGAHYVREPVSDEQEPVNTDNDIESATA